MQERKAVLIRRRGAPEWRAVAEATTADDRPMCTVLSIENGRVIERETRLDVTEVLTAYAHAGRIAVDLSGAYGRPTLFVKVARCAARGATRTERAPAETLRIALRERAAAKRHALARSTIDPRYDGHVWTGIRERAERAAYYHGVRIVGVRPERTGKHAPVFPGGMTPEALTVAADDGAYRFPVDEPIGRLCMSSYVPRDLPPVETTGRKGRTEGSRPRAHDTVNHDWTEQAWIAWERDTVLVGVGMEHARAQYQGAMLWAVGQAQERDRREAARLAG